MESNGSATAKVIVAILVLFFICIGVIFAIAPAKNQGYAPAQPLPFSHKLHAGKYNIPCMYCHISVETSRHATVPPMNVCMNCHKMVKTQSPYIKDLTSHYNEEKPMPWVKVHQLPSFTYFNHRRHIARGLKCEICHGDIRNMDRVRQYAPLTMGWCVNCHRQPQYNAPITCDTCHR